jgi:electron transfer flavoprotein alpha subunit
MATKKPPKKQKKKPSEKSPAELDYFFDESHEELREEESFGDRIRRLRKERDFTYQNLANETGFTPEYLKEVEENKIHPSISVILQLAKALKVESGIFLSAEDQTAAEQKRKESYEKRTQSYSYKTLTPSAAAKHMKAFHVSIEPKKRHKSVEFHHEGEEFIYLLEGELEVMVGDNRNILKGGDSIHFNSSITHTLKNLSSVTAELIVVVYTP